MKTFNLQRACFYIAIGIFLSFILNFLNCSGMQKFQNHESAKQQFHIKFELTGYGFVVVVNHTADNAINAEEEMLDLYWTATGGQAYSYSKTIRAIEGDTIFFKTLPKTHICSMQNALVTLKIIINGTTFLETSDQTSIWEEITLKRGMVPVYNYYHQK